MIDGHGDDLYRYGGKIRSNFSSNIFQGIDHSELKRHLSECLDVVCNYPEPAPYSVETMLSDMLDVPESCVMVTNGAAEAIHIIARAYQGWASAILGPTFAEYADACRLSNHSLASFHDIAHLPDHVSMVWICNPDNPTGRVFDRDTMLGLITDNPDKIFVIDQAYHKYTSARVLSPDDALSHGNVILLYSLTKDYAIPGLRLGYIVTNTDLMASLRAYRVPWSVNAVAIEAARFLLSRPEMPVNLADVATEVRRVSQAFANLRIEVLPSATNFMLCRLPAGRAADLKAYLVDKHNILIRDASNFEGLTLGHFRVAVQSRSENDALIEAVSLWMRS